MFNPEENTALVVQPGGSVWVKSEVLFEAMKKSGFVITQSCCAPTLEKMCTGDQYKGSLEGFANALVNLLRQHQGTPATPTESNK